MGETQAATVIRLHLFGTAVAKESKSINSSLPCKGNLTMSSQLNTATQSHADHRHWQSDIACWNDDIENWRAEHSHAIIQLQEALSRINEHGQCLDEHAQSVAGLRDSLEYHEKHIAASLQKDTNTPIDDALNDHHKQESELHDKQRDAHERMKKHHHQAMAKVAMLAKALEEAC
tara:strand:- start:243 stop:767 length:525 start_codon:yes stop_codon:yes gene_type:complete